MGRNAFYRLHYINLFAELFALIEYFKAINKQVKANIQNAVAKKIDEAMDKFRNLMTY